MRHFSRHQQFRNFQPIFRAVSVISAVAVLATGVTFAALQSQSVVLTGNSIKTAAAGLQIGISTASFASSRTGFVFGDVVPGGPAMPEAGNNFYLKNTGTSTLNLKAAVSTSPTNTSNAGLSKVYLVFTRVDTAASQKLPLSSLVAGFAGGGVALTDSLSGNNTVARYKYQVAMDADAFTGQSAEIGGIDVVFSGTAVAQ